MYYLTVAVGQDRGHGLGVGPLCMFSQNCNQGISWAFSSGGSTRIESVSKLMWVVDRIPT